MPYPREYERDYDFYGHQTANPNKPLPGDHVDDELNDIARSTREIVDFVKKFTLTDGRLAPSTVGIDQLDKSVRLGFQAPRPWESGAEYIENDTVFYRDDFWICTVAHISKAVFEPSKWALLAEFSTITAEPEGGQFTSEFDLPAPNVIRRKLSEQMSILDFAGTASVGNGSLDAATALQKAHDEFANAGFTAATLLVPPAEVAYLLDSPFVGSALSLKVKGLGQVYGPVGGGSMFKIANAGFDPLTFSGVLSRGSGLYGISFTQDQPNVTSGWAPTDYPAVVKCDGMLGEFFLHDVFGVKINRMLSSVSSGRAHVRNLRGQFFKNAIFIDNAQDCPDIDTVHGWPYWTDLPDVLAYQQLSLDLVMMGRADTPKVNNVFGIVNRSILRFITTDAGYTTQLRGGCIDGDRTKYTVWVQSDFFTGGIDQLGAQSELFSGAGATVAGGRAILMEGVDARFKVGQVTAQRYGKHAVEITGTNNKLTIGAGSEFWAFNGDNDGSGAVNRGDASNLVEFEAAPKLLDSYGAPLFHSGGVGVVGMQQNVPSGAVNEVRAYSGAAGQAARIAAIGSDTNVSLQIAAQGDADIEALSPIELPSDPTEPLHAAPKQYVDDRQAFPGLEDFGGRGDYNTDNVAALSLLFASGAKGLTLRQGVYRFSDGIAVPAGFTIVGVGAPTLGFGTLDDKQYLRHGYKAQIPGSVLIFSGAGTHTYDAPQRTDEYATMRPCVRLANTGLGSVGTHWRGFAIVQDMVCRSDDGTAFTRPDQDERADYEVGLLIDDAARVEMEDVVVFGYFTKAGTVISSMSGNDDPDYNTFQKGSTMGRHGLALLGSNDGPASFGLSGTRCFGTGLYSLDHHSRGDMITEERTDYYAGADDWSCLYIDGDVDASMAEINGFYFYGCELRTRANHALKLGYASNVQFFGGAVEQSPYGIPNSDIPTFLGSSEVKRGVAFHGLRMNYLSQVFNSSFAGTIPVPIIVSGDPLNGRLGVVHRDPDGGYSVALLGSDGGVGDSGLQMTKDANNGSSGWRTTWDISASYPYQLKYDGNIRYQVTTGGAASIRAPASGDASLSLASDNGAAFWALRTQVSSTNQFQFRYGGTGSPVLLELTTAGALRPGSTAAQDIGSASLAWSNLYLQNAPTVLSDETLKCDMSPIPAAWLAAARSIIITRYKMRSAVATKGRAARWHIGVSAQQVIQAFEAEGVDAFEIGIVGRDVWDDEYDDVLTEVLDGDGVGTGEYRSTGEKRLVRPAGESLSVRYDELFALLAAAAVTVS